MNYKKILLSLAQLLILGLVVTSAGFTSTSSYYLDASRLELQASPTTQTASGSVKVSSNSNRPIRLRVIPKLWHLSPQGVLTYDNPPTSGYNLLDNIGINPEEFELLPNKSKLVRFIVKVPPEADNAEYAFQLYFEPTTLLEASQKESGASVSNVLDVIPVFTTTVYVYQGNPVPKPKIEHFDCGYKTAKNQVSVNLDLSNAGTKHARLFGNVILNRKTAAGANQMLEVFHMQNSTLIIVFPNRQRLVQNDLDVQKSSRLEPGNYQLELQLVDERNVQPAIQGTCEFSVPIS